MIESIGGIIKLNRIQNELTLKYVSYKTGLSKGYLSRVERNKEGISFENVQKIFSLMGIEFSTEKIDEKFENDFYQFINDVIYMKDFEKSFLKLKVYEKNIYSSFSYIKYLLAEMIYNINIYDSINITDYFYIEEYFDYLESYQIVLFYDYIGVYFYYNNLHTEAIMYYDKAMMYKGNQYSSAMLNYHKSISLTCIERLTEAFDCAIQVRESFCEQLNLRRLVSISFQIAVIYCHMRNYKKSEEINLKCIEMFEELQMQKSVISTYNNLFWDYICAQEYNKILSKKDEALLRSNNDVRILFYISFAYYQLNNLSLAKKYIKKAKNNISSISDQYFIDIIQAFYVLLSDSSYKRKEKKLFNIYKTSKKIQNIQTTLFILEIIKDFYKKYNKQDKYIQCLEKLNKSYKQIDYSFIFDENIG